MSRAATPLWKRWAGRAYRRAHRALLRLYIPCRVHSLRCRKAANGQEWIAVIQIEHLGDIVACEPISRHLKQRHASARLFWLVRPRYRELLDFNPNVDEVLAVSCLGEALRLAHSGLFHAVYNLHFDGRPCAVFGDIVRKPAGPPPHITMSNYYEHGSLLELCSHSAGLPRLNEPCRIYIPDEVRRKVDRLKLPERFAVYHCRSNEKVRDWPAERFAELSRRIRSRSGLASVEIGLEPVLPESTPDLHRNLCGRLGLLETAEVIRRARLFVGIDSGPAHLANASAVPGVILLGHYLSFKRYLPYCGAYRDGGIARLLYADGPVSLLTIEQAEAAAIELLGERDSAAKPPAMDRPAGSKGDAIA